MELLVTLGILVILVIVFVSKFGAKPDEEEFIVEPVAQDPFVEIKRLAAQKYIDDLKKQSDNLFVEDGIIKKKEVVKLKGAKIKGFTVDEVLPKTKKKSKKRKKSKKK